MRNPEKHVLAITKEQISKRLRLNYFQISESLQKGESIFVAGMEWRGAYYARKRLKSLLKPQEVSQVFREAFLLSRARSRKVVVRLFKLLEIGQSQKQSFFSS